MTCKNNTTNHAPLNLATNGRFIIGRSLATIACRIARPNARHRLKINAPVPVRINPFRTVSATLKRRNLP
jgi:hypothetical protein